MEPNIRFLRSVFEVAHVEYQEYDLDRHKLLFSSGVAEKMLGYSPEEYFGLSEDFYKQLVYPDDWPLVRDTCDKLVSSQEGEVVEMTLRLRHHRQGSGRCDLYHWAGRAVERKSRKTSNDLLS